jgi:catechol 2,3-dioxygenase-like lactoylglutathione lyase family enzyme
MVRRIDNVGVAVSDLDAALAFYGRLGFEPEYREDRTPSAMLRAGDARLWVFATDARSGDRRSPDLAGNPTGLDHVSLWVGDVDAACARITGAGGELESGPADQDWGLRAATLLDPDGTRVFLLGDLKG